MLEAIGEQGGNQQRIKPSQINIGGWPELSPIWRLALLIKTYEETSAELLGVLGKTLLSGDEGNGRAALQSE